MEVAEKAETKVLLQNQKKEDSATFNEHMKKAEKKHQMIKSIEDLQEQYKYSLSQCVLMDKSLQKIKDLKDQYQAESDKAVATMAATDIAIKKKYEDELEDISSLQKKLTSSIGEYQKLIQENELEKKTLEDKSNNLEQDVHNFKAEKSTMSKQFDATGKDLQRQLETVVKEQRKSLATIDKVKKEQSELEKKLHKSNAATQEASKATGDLARQQKEFEEAKQKQIGHARDMEDKLARACDEAIAAKNNYDERVKEVSKRGAVLEGQRQEVAQREAKVDALIKKFKLDKEIKKKS